MTSLYAWQELNPADGRWGTITAIIPFLPKAGVTQLCARNREAMESLRPIAEQHSECTRHRLRLARYDYVATLDEIG